MKLTAAEEQILLHMFREELEQARMEFALIGSDEARASAAWKIDLLHRVIEKLERKTRIPMGSQPDLNREQPALAQAEPSALRDVALGDLLETASRVRLLLAAHATNPWSVPNDAAVVVWPSVARLALLHGDAIIAEASPVLMQTPLVRDLLEASAHFMVQLLNGYAVSQRKVINQAILAGGVVRIAIADTGVRLNLEHDKHDVLLGMARPAMH